MGSHQIKPSTPTTKSFRKTDEGESITSRLHLKEKGSVAVLLLAEPGRSASYLIRSVSVVPARPRRSRCMRRIRRFSQSRAKVDDLPAFADTSIPAPQKTQTAPTKQRHTTGACSWRREMLRGGADTTSALSEAVSSITPPRAEKPRAGSLSSAHALMWRVPGTCICSL